MKKNKIKFLTLRCEICGEDDRRYVFASPLIQRVICMKCAKETK